MAFTRKTLTGYGLTEEQLEKVMTLYSTSLADYIPKADMQAKIDEEVKKATENQPPVDVTLFDPTIGEVTMVFFLDDRRSPLFQKFH